MERPKGIDSGEAMRWNEEVNRRRLAYHEWRCTEDPMYRKAYEYMQAEERRMYELIHKPFAQMLAAAQEPQTVNDCMKDTEKPQRIKTHEEVLREQAAMDAFSRMSDAEKAAAGGNALAMGLIGMMFTCPDALQQRMKELEELKPYIDEIRETDQRFKNEEIKLSGFEW